jgi:hypothetical protein
MQDGTRYSARKGQAVTVSDEHAAAVHRFSGGDAAILNGVFRSFGGTRAGRWCQACKRLWNRWNRECPNCHAETVPEAEMPEQPACDRAPGR